MIRPAGVLLAVALLVPGAARADLQTYVEMCSGATSTPHQVINFCQRAIDTGQLRPTARAQVSVNLSIGYLDLGEYNSALKAANQAVKAKPDLVVGLLNRARVYEKLKRLDEAATDYQAAIRIDRNSAEAYFGRGVMLLTHGDPYRAVKDLTQAITLAPDWGPARFNRGLAYLQIGQHTRADGDFSELIRRNGRDAEAFLYRGQARAALNQTAAADDFDQAIALAEEWPLAWFVRGRYRDRKGDREDANADFLRAWELGHSDPWLLERMREISR